MAEPGWICFKCPAVAPRGVVDPACPKCGGRMKQMRATPPRQAAPKPKQERMREVDKAIDRLTPETLAVVHDARYSDEFVGNLVRTKFGRSA